MLLCAKLVLSLGVYMTRVLVAQDKNALAPVVNALQGYELVVATSFVQAEKVVRSENISLFVIGVHFDESRCMDLIHLIRKDPNHKITPIIVIRLLPSSNADLLRSTLSVMKIVHGVTDYIESVDASDTELRIRKAVDDGLFECSL